MTTWLDRLAAAVETRLAAEIATDGPEYDAVYDRARAEAEARGFGYADAHAIAARVADEWKAAQKPQDRSV